MQNAADRLTITGATLFGGGSEDQLLTEGILTTSGRFTQDGTNSTSSFAAVGNHITRISSNYPGGNTVSFGTPQASAFMNLELAVPVTFASDILIFNDFTNSAAGAMSPQRFAVQGAFTQTGNSAFTPRKLVFYGPSISVTNGSLAPDTVEFRQNPLAFTWPVGARYTWNHALMNFSTSVTLGTTAPALASLNLSDGATFNLNNLPLSVAGTLTAVAGTMVNGGGNSGTLTARQFQVSGLTADNVRLVLTETAAQTQQFSNVTFQNYGASGQRLLTVNALGAAGPRALGFSNLTFPTLSIGAGNFYVTTTSTNAQPYQLTMTGGNVTSATGPTFTSPGANTSVVWP
jgi:hypothetical protein